MINLKLKTKAVVNGSKNSNSSRFLLKGNRQERIEAGAPDYITKPLKIDQLLSLMRI